MHPVTIRPGILTSPNVAKVSVAADLFYRSLLHHVDAAGIVTSDPAKLRDLCFPRRRYITAKQVEQWINECVGPLLERHGDQLRVLRWGKDEAPIEIVDPVETCAEHLIRMYAEHAPLRCRSVAEIARCIIASAEANRMTTEEACRKLPNALAEYCAAAKYFERLDRWVTSVNLRAVTQPPPKQEPPVDRDSLLTLARYNRIEQGGELDDFRAMFPANTDEEIEEAWREAAR